MLNVSGFLPVNSYNMSNKISAKNRSTETKSSRSVRMNTNSLSFKGYYGDPQPLKKLFYNVTGRNSVYEDAWTHSHIWQVGMKKWVNAHPAELLKRTVEQTIQSICTIIKPNDQYPGIPSYIPSPNFGDKWGRHANYIEINPRAIAKFDGNRVSEGLLQAMKLLPAIPTSPNSFANCIVLSQLYPSVNGDGYKNSDSLYCVNLHTGISKNLTSDGLIGKVGEDEQVKAYNDAAHLLGFKTAFRMPLSSGQLKVQGRDFNWYEHEKAFIDACVWAIELGFDAIYFDSAKHIIHKDCYAGIGNLPNKDQMSYILYEIRNKTGRNDLAFIGEKCNDDLGFKSMGFTAGTDWGKADDFNSVLWESKKQAPSREYAAGPEVSNDNDCGAYSYETRLNRINSCLFGYEYVPNKLPTYMQIHDLMPLSPYTNTHDLMMRATQMSGSGAWTECERHWDGIFNGDIGATHYRNNAFRFFENFIRYRD